MGVGTGQTGCWLRLTAAKQALFRFVLQHIGLPPDALKQDFDSLYVARVLELVRGSSLDAAVILAMDHVYDSDGNHEPRREIFHVPNDYVLRLARCYPEFIPAVSIHPARRDALDELEKCVAGGAAMLKLLPLYQNVDCNNPRYGKFWERMAQFNLPLLVHTGGEHTVPNNAPHLRDPHIADLPLKCGVTVIAAHCASKSGLFDPDHIDILSEMMQRHERLYADNSAFNIPFRSRAFRPSLKEPIVSRLIHGSDFPVFIYSHWAWLRGLIDYRTFRRCEREANVIERDYQIKRAAGFPETVFTRLAGLLRSA
jgi:Predicted metal-dependent hydrolase of the TIM-barrel fold